MLSFSAHALWTRNKVSVVSLAPLLLAGCSSYHINNAGQGGTLAHAQITVQVSPNSESVYPGQVVQFTATVSGAKNQNVIWSVDGVDGGNTEVGIVDGIGNYSAPASIPKGSAVNLTATSVADPNAKATAVVVIKDQVTISPTYTTLVVGDSVQFHATLNGSASSSLTWSVNGAVGGNLATGTITSNGNYTAPSLPLSADLTVTASDPSDPTAYASASITVFDPLVDEAHRQWLDGVASAAASYGCANIQIEQQSSESIDAAIARFGTAGTEGSCLVLFPVSTDPSSLRYSLAWGGQIEGKDILYISDVGEMRIWNCVAVP